MVGSEDCFFYPPPLMKTTLSSLVLLCLALFATPLSAQIVGGGWTTHHQFDGSAADDRLGYSVSGAGDVDGDGFADLIVGAYFADPGGLPYAGSAYVYSGLTGALLHQFDGSAADDYLGNSVSGAGDVDGDGFADLIVGTYGADPGGLASAGSAYVYGFNPFMTASPTSFSVATGVTIIYDLDFPMAAAGLDYKIVISTTGTGPFHWGVDIPLTIDRLALMTFSGSYPFHRAWNMQGILDANGNGTGQIGTVPGDHAAYIGSTAWWVAIVIPTGSLASYSSVAVPITIMP